MADGRTAGEGAFSWNIIVRLGIQLGIRLESWVFVLFFGETNTYLFVGDIERNVLFYSIFKVQSRILLF